VEESGAGIGVVEAWCACMFVDFSCSRELVQELARTVVAPPSSVVKCLWEVFIWGFGVLFLSCACVSVPGVLFSLSLCVCVCVCVCDLLIFLRV